MNELQKHWRLPAVIAAMILVAPCCICSQAIPLQQSPPSETPEPNVLSVLAPSLHLGSTDNGNSSFGSIGNGSNVFMFFTGNNDPALDEVVVTAVGDVMLGSTFPDASGGELPPNDGADLLKDVTPYLKEGDVVFGNLEGPLMDGGSSGKCRHKRPGSCYAFRVPTRYGAHLKAAGFNVMGLANNHALDFGQDGRASSRKTLETLGIAHSGEIGDIAWLSVKNKKVAVISFATYPGAHNFLDLEDTVGVIRETRAKADIVIVSFHGGAEGVTHQHVPYSAEFFLGENRGDLRRFAHAAIDAGAQLILGSGPHVVRGMEIYHGKLIAYSLGNFATYGAINVSGVSGLSAVLKARLAADGSFLSGCAYPTWQEKGSGPKIDSEKRILPILRSLSEEDFKQDAVQVGPNGELSLPGVQAGASECTGVQQGSTH